MPYPPPGSYCSTPHWRNEASSTTSCNPDTLLYLGADLDVHMLKYMQPWERQAVFYDQFKDDAVPPDLLLHYEDVHRRDSRPAWKNSSRNMRPCPKRECAWPLTQLLQARMEEDPAFTRVRAVANLTIRFELRRQYGLTRTLHYMLENNAAVIEARWTTPRHDASGGRRDTLPDVSWWGGADEQQRGLSWHHSPASLRVSTIAMPGSAFQGPGKAVRAAFRRSRGRSEARPRWRSACASRVT